MTSKTASALMRIAIGLYWSAGILLAFAAVIIVGAMGWTTTPEALVRASFITVAFGLPAIVLFLLASSLEGIRYNEQLG